MTVHPDIDCEQALLGAMLLAEDARVAGIATCEPADFALASCGEIFAAIKALHERGDAIDAVTVTDEWRRRSTVPDAVEGAKLISLMIEVPAISHAREYAREVVRNATARRVEGLLAEAKVSLGNHDDPWEVMDQLVSRLQQVDRPMVSDQAVAVSIPQLQTDEAAYSPWVIPGILRQDWRCVLVGLEGSGKSTLLRQLAQTVAQGVHPFRLQRFEPQRTLLVDLENPVAAILETGLQIDKRLRMEVGDAYDPDRCVIYRRLDGMNLRSRVDRLALEREIAAQRPTLVCMGPAYKLVRRQQGRSGAESYEEATEPVLAVLDDLRTRYGFALVIEHHAAKGQAGTVRSLDPYGSQRWLAWPELGLSIRPDKERLTWAVEHHRGDRLANNWPDELVRGEFGYPFAGRWKNGVPQDF